MHEMWNIAYAKADLMFLGVERDFKKKKGLKKEVHSFERLMPKNHLKFIIIIIKECYRHLLSEVEFSFMTHIRVSKQTPWTMFRQFEFKFSQVFPISWQYTFNATKPVGIMRAKSSTWLWLGAKEHLPTSSSQWRGPTQPCIFRLGDYTGAGLKIPEPIFAAFLDGGKTKGQKKILQT